MQFRRLIASDIIGIINANLEGKIIEANDTFLRMTGYTREDLLGGRLDWSLMTPPEYADLDTRALEKLTTQGFFAPFEKEFISKEGSRIPVVIGGALLDSPEMLVIAYVLDQKERKQAEADIHFHAAVLSQVNDAVITIGHDERVTYWNNGAETLYDIPAAEAIGKPLAESYSYSWLRPDDEQEANRSLAETGSWRGQNLHLTKHGKSIHVESSVTVLRDEKGKQSGLLAAIRDVTDQVKAAQQLSLLLAREKQRAEQLRSLAEASLDVNASLTVEDVLRVITHRARLIIGAHQAISSVTLDQNWAQAMNTVSLSEKYAEWRTYREALDGSGIYSFVSSTNKPVRMTQAELEAHPHWNKFGASAERHPPMRGWLAAPFVGRDGQNLGIIQMSDKYDGEFTEEDQAILVQLAQVASVAIENARLLREVQSSVRSREQLLSVVSHDLKNPLGVIKGFSQLLSRRISREGTVEAARVSDTLAKIDASTNRMEKLIDDLLDFARLQAGQLLNLKLGPVDIMSLVRRVSAECQESTKRHKIVVETDRASLVGNWDETRLEQVLNNLFSNAIKYSPDGGSIVVSVSGEEKEGEEWAVLVVKDEGVGIPSSDLPYIFEWYRRAANVSEDVLGSGIGLASARQLIKQHGGNISASSRQGEGATFTIKLPLNSPTQSPPDSDPKESSNISE